MRLDPTCSVVMLRPARCHVIRLDALWFMRSGAKEAHADSQMFEKLYRDIYRYTEARAAMNQTRICSVNLFVHVYIKAHFTSSLVRGLEAIYYLSRHNLSFHTWCSKVIRCESFQTNLNECAYCNT